MWIHGSTLSVSQRSLLPERELSPTLTRAQGLATQLIQGYSARHTAQEALEFICDVTPCEVTSERGYLRLNNVPPSSPAVPPGYGFKGGAARETLISSLKIRKAQQPRDLDLVRRGHHKTPADDELARRIMPRDFELGARVELIRDLDGYLRSRDLTINEVVLIDSTIYASTLCLLDTIGHVIRPARYRGGTLHRKPSLYGQSLLKMARLYAEGAQNGENWSIMGIPDTVSFSEFDLAVHLNKAFQRSRGVAHKFLHTCEVLSLIAATNDPVRNALEELEYLRHGERGLFPDVPEGEWEQALK